MGKTRTEHMYEFEVVRRESEARATLKGFFGIRGCSWVDGEEGEEGRDLRSRLAFFDEVFSRLQSLFAGTDWLAVSRASPALARKYLRTYPLYPVPLHTSGPPGQTATAPCSELNYCYRSKYPTSDKCMDRYPG